ncbi:MAG: 4Fe-4S ferredoxin, partial [Verrucomicrobia bacterium]
VCPSGALFFGPREDIEKYRREKPVNEFQFGRQRVRTKVNIMTAPENDVLPIDIADFLPRETPDMHPRPGARPGAPDAADAAIWNEWNSGPAELATAPE